MCKLILLCCLLLASCSTPELPEVKEQFSTNRELMKQASPEDFIEWMNERGMNTEGWLDDE